VSEKQSELALDESVLEEVLREEDRDEAGAPEPAAPATREGDEVEDEDAADPDPRGHVDQPPPDEDEPAPRGLVKIKELQGVPLFYERDGNPRPFPFLVADSFLPNLRRTVQQVVERVPEQAFGRLQRISSAGTFVNKPGMHGKGRAMDWDRWAFEKLAIAPIQRHHEAASKPQRQRYWALAAICRANSAFILHGRYDAAHADHIHHDDSSRVGFAQTRSTVALVQAVLNDIFDATPQLEIDGGFGGKTKGALERAMRKVGLSSNFTDADQFVRFLRRSGRLGFRRSVGMP
jgi:hypothetical protein